MAGFDGATDDGTRLGVFFGGAAGKIDADFNSQETDVKTVFGGLYASRQMGTTAVDAAVLVGYSNYDRERRVANNLVANGVQTASAEYNAWLVSPEITFTQPVPYGGQRLEASLTLRYSGLFLDGISETGAADALTIEDRDIHVFQARTQLSLPNERTTSDGGIMRNAVYIGLEGRAQAGNKDVTGTLLAQNITFDPGGDSKTAGAFVGFQFEQTNASGITFYADIEGQVETGINYLVSGNVGIKFRF